MKKVLSLVALLVLTVSLAGCGSSSNTLKLGTIGPLTGDYSLYGVSVRDGAQLAVDELNAAGGVLDMDVELFSYDSKGDTVEGVNAYNRLRDVDEVNALIGATFSGVTSAIKELAVEDGMPVFTPTATKADITLGASNVFRACYSDDFQGQMAAKFADESLEASTAAVIYNRDDAYSEGLAQAFITEWEKRGTVIVTETFGNGDDDYSVILDSVKASNADVVFLPGYVTEVGAILTQADTKGLEMPFIGGDGWDSLEEKYATVAEGNYFGNHYAKTDDSELVQDFVSSYTEKYGSAPNALAALAYDAVYAAAEAYEAAGSVEAEDFIAALSKLDFTGVTGHVSFDENGDPIKAVTMIQIVDGKHVVITKLEEE